MNNPSPNRLDFIAQAKALVLENIANEHFGVSELADALHMSRSNLLRKIKKQTKQSASQFIRQVRLTEAMALLKDSSMTVSEVSYQVGFGSTSYFIKCFREEYGYPPGEVGKDAVEAEKVEVETNYLKRYQWPLIVTTCTVLLIVSLLLFSKKGTVHKLELEKSIAVLPFKNESADSTNLYFVNGLMESTLNNLQKIEDLRVISRTSVEKYRKADKGIPEIAEELNVNYLIEGSGQRVGNQVLLNIQLIEASSDTPVWSEQYNQEITNLFNVQNDVAKKIAIAVKAIVTPQELEQIEKRPTEDLIAYDYYLQALDPFYSRTQEGLLKAIPLFERATEQDPEFAMAYANLAIAYYFLDIHKNDKQYTELINNYSDKALLYDSKNDVSLISKALYYMHVREYRLALPHLEKALEYNPNSASVINLLGSLFTNYIPDTGKYLKYALKGIQLDVDSNDSITQSFIYLNISNALAQSGFTKQAMEYVDKAIAYNKGNPYAPHLKIFIKYAQDQNLEKAKGALITEFEKDTTRLDLLQEVAKLYYFQEDYTTAFRYYKKFVTARTKRNLGVYPHEDLRIGIVYYKMGLEEEALEFFRAYSAYCQNDKSIYKSASLAFKYAHEGKMDEGIEQLKIFSKQDHYQYWLLLFLEKDPLIKVLQKHTDYQETVRKIEDRFWENQAKLKIALEEEGLL
jgi:TolB-like protein/AraC-like DNA-binding protein